MAVYGEDVPLNNPHRYGFSGRTTSKNSFNHHSESHRRRALGIADKASEGASRGCAVSGSQRPRPPAVEAACRFSALCRAGSLRPIRQSALHHTVCDGIGDRRACASKTWRRREMLDRSAGSVFLSLHVTVLWVGALCCPVAQRPMLSGRSDAMVRTSTLSSSLR